MVREQIRARGVSDEAVLGAMRRVPRHLFVPLEASASAYEDHPIPIGHGQTISQPYIVAYMTEALRIAAEHTVLEVGTGSAYQTAVLCEVAREVYSIEILESFGSRAAALLEAAGCRTVHLRIGDGYSGWPEKAPFDRIMVTAAPDHVPQPLVDQLAVGGRMVIPVGRHDQELIVLTKTADGVVQHGTIGVRFVPLTRKRP